DSEPAPENGDRYYRSIRSRSFQRRQKRNRRRRGRGKARDPLRDFGRSSPDVSQADGTGAAADPRAGSANFKANRGSGASRPATHQSFRLYRQGASRFGAEISRRTRTIRPRDSRQKNRESGTLHEVTAASLPESGETRRNNHDAVRSDARSIFSHGQGTDESI